MKVGDKVTGEPVNKGTRRKYPMVTGYYDYEIWEAMGQTHKTEFVMVGDVAVDCEKIRAATRREKETVLE